MNSDLSALNPKAFRRNCSECGSTSLVWGTALDLLRDEMEPESKKDLREMITVIGGDADAWRCSNCGNFGVFGPTHVDFA